MPRSLMLPFLALTAILTIAPHAAPAGESPTLDGTTWVLADLAASEAPLADVPVTLTFNDGKVTGSDGCNRFSGAYEATEDGLHFTPGATTMMACRDLASEQARLYRQAMRFRQALEATDSAKLVGEQLVLTGEGGDALARFAPQDLTLAGTRWRISGYNDGRQAVTSPLSDTVLTLDFGTDDGLAGTSGCNRYRAGYTVTGPGKIAVGPVLGTRRLCSDPEGIMRQENGFTAALGRVRSYRIDGDRLEFRDAGGAIQVIATRRAPTEPESEAATVAKADKTEPAAKPAPAPEAPKKTKTPATVAKADKTEPAAKPAPAPAAPKAAATPAPAKTDKPAATAKADKPAATPAKPAPEPPKKTKTPATVAKADKTEPAAKPAPAPAAPKAAATPAPAKTDKPAAPAKADKPAATPAKPAPEPPKKTKTPATVAKADKTEPAAKPAPAPAAPKAAATAKAEKPGATAEEASPAKSTPDAAAPAPRGAMSAPALARKGAASTQANGLPAAEAQLARGRRAARGLPERIGNYQIGDNAATWTARMRDGYPVVVDEERVLGDYGESRVTFHFDDGDLVAYRESGFRRTANGGTEALEILCLYEDGHFVDGYKRIDGLPKTLSPYEQNGPLLQAIAVRDRIADAK